MAKKNYDELAKLIIENVGGKDNITQVQHCITRLRFQLKDMDKPNTEVLSKTPGVIKVMIASGQYQVVIGNAVSDVYEAVCRLAGVSQSPAVDAKEDDAKEEAKEKKGIGALILEYMSAIIYPVLSLLTAAGILKGLLTIATMVGVSSETGMYILFNAVADALFYFLPVFLGYNTAKKSGMTPHLGMMIGAILCYPAVNGADLNFFGHTINVTYTSTFLPVVLIVLLATPLEKWLRKVLPSVIKNFVAPLIVLAIAIPIGYCLVGPAANALSEAIMNFINLLYGFSPVLVGALIGAFWQVLVVFGLHGMLIGVCMFNIFNGGGDMILAISIFICFAQSATVLAMALRAKNKEFRDLALPTVISGIFGVTEPAIYGITLPRIKYFIISCIGGAAAGIVCGLTGVKKYAPGSGIFALPTLINTENPAVLPLLLAAVAGIGVSFALTMVLFREKDIEI